jgi:hypothetical protein
MRLHVLNGCELGHVSGTGAPEHLVRDAFDLRFLARLLKHAEQEIIRVDGRSSWEGKIKFSLGSVFVSGRSTFNADGMSLNNR